jgi:hypothetical protein
MVEILHYERANRNKVIGYLDILVPINTPTNLIFRKIAHIQSGDRKWFNLPTFSRVKYDGTSDYLKYVQFQTEVYNGQLMESLSEKVKQFCEQQSIEEIVNMNFENTLRTTDELPF